MRLSRRSVGSPMSRPLRPQLRQLLLAVTATSLCAWCAPQKNSQPQAQPNSAMTPQAGVLRVEARSVLVDVIVTDKKGHAHPAYPQELLNVVGPRNMVHCWATDTDDPTEMPRWGKIGKQKIEDAGTPFFLWLNPTRMHIVTHLSPKYEALRNSQNGWTIHEAGMAQLDDVVGSVMQKLKDMGVDDNTIVMFTTDNGTENFTWPDGGQTPFYGGKGTGYEGGFRAPAMIRWPGHVPAGKVENGIISGLDWFPTFVAAAGDPNIKLRKS